MIKKLLTSVILIPTLAFAHEGPIVKELEAKVQNLSTRLEVLEGHFKNVQKGGFSIVAVQNCELNTPFDGNYVATELSKAAAIAVIVENCKQKAKNKHECVAQRVVCK